MFQCHPGAIKWGEDDLRHDLVVDRFNATLVRLNAPRCPCSRPAPCRSGFNATLVRLNDDGNVRGTAPQRRWFQCHPGAIKCAYLYFAWGSQYDYVSMPPWCD